MWEAWTFRAGVPFGTSSGRRVRPSVHSRGQSATCSVYGGQSKLLANSASQLTDFNRRLPELLRLAVSFNNQTVSAIVDTGSQATLLSVAVFRSLPCTYYKEMTPVQMTFSSASGQILPFVGCFSIPFRVNDVEFSHIFHVVDSMTENCILGLDFIELHKFVYSASSRELVCFRDNRKCSFVGTVKGNVPVVDPFGFEPTQTAGPSNLTPSELQSLDAFLADHSGIFATKMSELGKASTVKHEIKTTGGPIRCSPYRSAHSLRHVIKEQIDEMLQYDIIRPSVSPYASPVVMIPKKDGKMRFCIDYRKLNSVTVKDRYPLPRIDFTLDALFGARYFTTLDLFSGYWQLELADCDKHKTAFISEFGLFEFNRMPFGLANAPSTFQRAMNDILKKALYKYCLVYLDDVIIYSSTFEEHLLHLAKVFKMLAKAGLKLKREKCAFARTSVGYLGHVVSNTGVRPDPIKVKAIVDFKTPGNVAQLKSYLGLTGYYRKYVRNYAQLTHSLTQLTKKDVPFEWGEAQESAFQELKSRLTSDPILRYPNFARAFTIYTDASGFGIGSVLAQVQRNVHDNTESEVVIAYASKHLTERESKWPTIEKEAYAIVHAVKHFYAYLYGRKFQVVTDHRPLEWLMNKRDVTGRLARWSLLLQEFDIDIAYRPGKSNQNADCLSRSPVNFVQSSDSLGTPTTNFVAGKWVAAQEADAYCMEKRKQVDKLQTRNGITMLEHELLGTRDGRLLVPATLRTEVLANYHDHKLSGHLGISKTYARLQNRFKWPKMRKDVVQYVRSCLTCAKRKAYGRITAPLTPMPIPDYAWERVAMDIVGPLTPTARGNVYILVMSDYVTRYVETAPMPDQTAASVARCFIDCIILRHGCPAYVLSDQGTNFLSDLMTSLCKMLGIAKIRTVGYNPKCDGLVEKFNATMCDMLASFVVDDHSRWDEFLKYVTHAYNCSVHTTLGDSPFFMVFGRDAVDPHDVLPPSRYRLITNEVGLFSAHWHRAMLLARSNLEKAQAKMKAYYDNQGTKDVVYNVGDKVLLRELQPSVGKFHFRWSGPYTIVKRHSNLNYAIRSDDRPAAVVVNTNRLKPFTVRSSDAPINVVPPVEPIEPQPSQTPPPTCPTNVTQPTVSVTNRRSRSSSVTPPVSHKHNLRKVIQTPARYRN